MKLPTQSPSTHRSNPGGVVFRPRIEPQASLPIHGNYCGLGHGDETYRTRARDPVDQVCKEHDKCWDDNGTLDCNCDRELISKMARAVTAPGVDAPARAAGTAAIAYFSVAPCICKKEVCVNVPYCNIRGCGVRRVCHTVTTPGVGGQAPGCG